MSTPDSTRPREASRVWAITALGVAVVLACLALGAWQLDRARTRDTPTAAGDPMAVPALPLVDAVPADGRVGAGAQPVAVTVTGRYDQDHQFLVPGREQGGTPATYVVTPLIRTDGNAVLVARGWLPGSPLQGEPGPPPAPIGEVTVTGWLVPSEPLEAATVDPLTLPDDQVATVTAARLAGLLPYPILDGYVGLVDEQVAPAEPAGPVQVAALNRLAVPQVEATVHWSMQSLFYAFEWWFFALVVVWMWAQAVSLERRRVADDGRAAADQGAGDVPAVPPSP